MKTHFPPSKRKMAKESDWDIPYYEYLWGTVLNRNVDEFWHLSPKKLFQIKDKHILYNTVKDGKEERRREIVNGTEWM